MDYNKIKACNCGMCTNTIDFKIVMKVNEYHYLKDIASRDNNVVKAQLASIFGVTMSDLQAITNLATSTASVAGTDLDYAGALATLMDRANTMWQKNKYR